MSFGAVETAPTVRCLKNDWTIAFDTAVNILGVGIWTFHKSHRRWCAW